MTWKHKIKEQQLSLYAIYLRKIVTLNLAQVFTTPFKHLSNLFDMVNYKIYP